MQIVETYARSYFADMDALGVVRPDISPRASGHIPEQIKMIERLLEKGYAYVTDSGNVYFDVYGGRNTASCRIAAWKSRKPARAWMCAKTSAPRRFRAVEGRRARAHFALGQPLGRRVSRLAYRMLGHVAQIPGRYIRYSRRRRG